MAPSAQRGCRQRPHGTASTQASPPLSAPCNPAGKIAHSCREGDPPAALCIGAESINHAIKAVAIARGYVAQDGLDISFQPAFRDTDRSKKSLALYLSKQRTRATITTTGDLVDMPM